MEFRSLMADEIECRVGQIAKNGSGLSLLLYKDARCDMNLLDEVLGTEDWQCRYDVINGQLFCTVSVWSERHQEWVSKQDVGAPSNMEAEKGRASDAFKRACFKLGIGRELYTAPRIWVYAQDRNGSVNCNIKPGKNGKPQCYDEFSVSAIEVENHVIRRLEVRNDTSGKVVFSWLDPEYAERMAVESMLNDVTAMAEELAQARGVDSTKVMEALMASAPVSSVMGADGVVRTAQQAQAMVGQLKAWIESVGKERK